MLSTFSAFDTVLVANRGEIALRVIRTLRRLGIRSVAVHSDADAGARHVREADIAVRLAASPELPRHRPGRGGGEARPGRRPSTRDTGSWPRTPTFARRCAQAGLVFVGPPPEAVEAMGDKIRAKATVSAAGVPVVPGGAEHRRRPGGDRAERRLPRPDQAVRRRGWQGHAGGAVGGGAAAAPWSRPAVRPRAAFGDDTLLVERFVDRPPAHRDPGPRRHARATSSTWASASAACSAGTRRSSRRRPRRCWTTADPADDGRGRRPGREVGRLRGRGHRGVHRLRRRAGAPGYFMEMNTRLQVEHPVTEMVTGLDLVELQLRVAAGEPLPLTQDEVRLRGHAVEARVYAEDPARGFLPTGGRVLALAEPEATPACGWTPGSRSGAVVGSDYDPMLAKVIACGADRETAMRRLDAALAGHDRSRGDDQHRVPARAARRSRRRGGQPRHRADRPAPRRAARRRVRPGGPAGRGAGRGRAGPA